MHKPLVAAAGVLLLASGALAQEVTEHEFLSALQEDGDAIRSLEEGIARAERNRVASRTLANPRLDFWREQPDSSPEVTNWTLAWTPPLDGRYGLGKKAAEEGLAAAQGRFEADRAALRREFRRVFAEWSVAFERREILGEQLEIVAALTEHERQRAVAGEGSGLAARRFALAEGEVRVEAGAADAIFVRADAAARALQRDLAAQRVPARTVLDDPPAAIDASDAPQLRALESEIAQVDYEAKRAGRFLGFPTLQLGWQTIEGGGADDDGPILAAGWSLPILDRDQGARLEAERMRGIVGARLAVARARLAGEVAGGLNAYRALFESARDAAGASAESQAVIDAATAAFRAGEAGLTDLLDALRSAFAARLMEIDARARALEAHRDLEAAIGKPLPKGGRS